MDTIFPILIGIALAAVLVVLALGIFNLVRSGPRLSGPENLARAKRSNTLMQWRVILQGTALLLMFVGAMIAASH